MVPMRRNAESLFESATEMMRAQARDASKRAQRYFLGNVLFDVVGNGTRLPTGKAAAICRQSSCRPLTRLREFVGKHVHQRFQIRSAPTPAIQNAFQFDGRCPERRVLEVHPWCMWLIVATGLLEFGWIEVKICRAHGRAGLVPLIETMPGRYECQLVGELSKARWG